MKSDFHVLLIATNAERDPYPVYPIGAAMIGAALREHGVRVRALDFAAVDDPVAATSTDLRKSPADLVAISLRAVDTTSSLDPRSYLAPVADLVAIIRGLSAAPVVIGGPGYSLFPEQLVRFLGADFGVVGEGEETVLELVDALRVGIDPGTVPGVFARTGDRVTGGGRRSPLPPERWSTPDLELFPVEPHLAAGGMASVQSKRGCPLDCSYCTYPNLEGRRLRLREPREVAAEVARLVDRGVDYMFFVDNNFNIPAEHAMAVCRELEALERRPEWSAFLTPYGFLAEHAARIAAAGARSLEFGAESGHPAVLDGLGKHHRAEHIRLSDRACLDAGVTPAHYFIFGGPNETADTVEHSLALIAELQGPVAAMLGIRVYPHTRLHERAVAEGVVVADDSLLEPTFYFSPQVDPEQVADRLAAVAAEVRNFIVIGAEDGLNRKLVARLRAHGRRGPLWEFMRR